MVHTLGLIGFLDNLIGHLLTLSVLHSVIFSNTIVCFYWMPTYQNKLDGPKILRQSALPSLCECFKNSPP